MAEDHDLDRRGMNRVMDEVRQLKRGLSASTQNPVATWSASIYWSVRSSNFAQQDGHRWDRYPKPGRPGQQRRDPARDRWRNGLLACGRFGSVTASQQAFGQLTLTPHRMGADTFYTKQLLNQASLSVEAFVRDDLVAARWRLNLTAFTSTARESQASHREF
jgi:hypothetical protein